MWGTWFPEVGKGGDLATGAAGARAGRSRAAAASHPEAGGLKTSPAMEKLAEGLQGLCWLQLRAEASLGGHRLVFASIRLCVLTLGSCSSLSVLPFGFTEQAGGLSRG